MGNTRDGVKVNIRVGVAICHQFVRNQHHGRHNICSNNIQLGFGVADKEKHLRIEDFTVELRNLGIGSFLKNMTGR